jgi:hypothetical protein
MVLASTVTIWLLMTSTVHEHSRYPTEAACEAARSELGGLFTRTRCIATEWALSNGRIRFEG